VAFLSLGTLPWLLWLPPKNKILSYFELLLSRFATLSSVLPGTLTRQCLRRHYKKGAPSIWMKFLVRMYWWMVPHILYLAKGNGDVLYHLPEKQFVPDENHVKWSFFSSTCNCGQMVQKFPGNLVKARKREYLQRYYLFSQKHSTEMNHSINFKISMELPKIPFKW